MKIPNLIFLFFIGITLQCTAQPKLVGLATRGGEQFGTIFKYTAGDTAISEAYHLTGNEGKNPNFSHLVFAAGKLYGVTYAGGAYEGGILFDYNFNTNKLTKKVDFKWSLGLSPQSSPMIASNGKMYGVTTYGAVLYNGYGALYEYDYNTDTYTQKIYMSHAQGRNPMGTLVEAPNGKLYGVAQGGAGNNVGAIFEYDFNTNIYTKKIDLDTTTGYYPNGGMMLAANGKLYGCMALGGANNLGVIYEYDPTINIYTSKVNMTVMGGFSPRCELIEVINGKLYGVAFYGGSNNVGVIFEYDYLTNTYTKKIDLSTSTGSYPFCRLFKASNNKLYGMTSDGGINSEGVIFEYDYMTNSYTKKFDFSLTTGRTPIASFMQAPNGRLYAMTSAGGSGNGGVLFEYNISSGAFTPKHHFSTCQGSEVSGQVIRASNGLLYGTTLKGGQYDLGVLFEYNYNANSYTKKYDFSFASGSMPTGYLTEAANGNLLGLASANLPSANEGAIFEYNITANTYTKKVEFTNATGMQPKGRLLQSSNGKYYGVTYKGGINGEGTIFEYDYSTNTITKKVDLSLANGSKPLGSLIESSNGKLYGMTLRGGTQDDGVLFEYDIITNTYTKKIDFNDTIGSYPRGSLIEATNGKLYGLTSSGGTYAGGVLFEYDITSNILTPKHNFNVSFGDVPYNTLFEASNEKLYGTTTQGGANDHDGTIFEFDYNAGVFTKKVNLVASFSGHTPDTEFLEVECPAPAVSASGPVSFCLGGSVVLNAISNPGSTYQWKRNGIVIPGATGPTYPATAKGKYTVTTAYPTCVTPLTSTFVQIFIPCMPPDPPIDRIGLFNDEDTHFLSVTPNPGNGLFSINASDGRFTLQNALGEVVFVTEIMYDVTSMDLTHLPGGIYFATLESGENVISRKVVVVK